MSLTAKQKLFCQKYATTLNATKSAIAAGYSEKSAYSQGARLLKKDEIQKYLMELQKERSQADKSVLPTKEELIKFWTRIVRDEKEKTSNRLSAAQCLAKSYFMFNADICDWSYHDYEGGYKSNEN